MPKKTTTTSTGTRKKKPATAKQYKAAAANPWLKFMEGFRKRHPQWKSDAKRMLQEGAAEYHRK